MYNKVDGGTKIDVKGITCWVPPVGYGVNRITGELEYIGVYSRSTKKKEQKFERILLPEDYRKKRNIEEKREVQDSEYFDPELEEIRSMHWKYRLCGFWFMNNGVETYITGTHWLYLNWCATNVGYMKYRKHDRLLFYAWRSIEDDPNCGGLVYITRRRAGKTYIAAAIEYDRITTSKNKVGGMQSKTDDDAKSIYDKIVNYFTNMPHFFRPNYDWSKGTRPAKALKFFNPSTKGKLSDKEEADNELKSIINFGTSNPYFYDGQALYSYTLDEFGKPQKSDTWQTWQVVRYCLNQDGEWIGKAFVTSTIEDLDTTGQAPKLIWKNSNQLERDANGETKSGLYSIFFGAHETTFLKEDVQGQEHGEPDVDKCLEFYNNRRDAMKSDLKQLYNEVRKNPFTIEEAFTLNGDQCIYNAALLNDRHTVLSWKENLTTRGNFVWENGVRDTRVTFEPNPNGRFEVCSLLPDDTSNKVLKRGEIFQPNGSLRHVMGVDPFDHNITEDGRKSNGAGVVLRKYDAASKDLYNYAFVASYVSRPDSAPEFYEDMLMMAVYYGCFILFENQKVNLMHYFNDRGYGDFLMWLPERLQPGIASSPKTIQQIAELTEAYINGYIDKVFFKNLITDWLDFRIDKTTKFDFAMAVGYCLIADQSKVERADKEELRDVEDYFKMSKV